MECLHCSEPIKSGRADRKFCSDACKNEYHNAQKIGEHAEIKKITLALKKNRRILKSMLGNNNELYVVREELVRRGYDFDFHTHHVTSSANNEFILCFNYGYRVMENGRFKIVRWRQL
jgi:hypothetical protein